MIREGRAARLGSSASPRRSRRCPRPAGGGLVGLLLAAAGATASPADAYTVEDFLGAAVFRDVAITADGGRLAAVTARSEWPSGLRRVALVQLDLGATGAPAELVAVTDGSGEVSAARWSPDGGSLAFAWAREAAPPQLYLAAGGAEPQPLTDEATFPQGVAAFAWMPAGGALIVAGAPAAEGGGGNPASTAMRRFAGARARTRLLRLDLREGDGPRLHALREVELAVRDLRVSPDGSQAALLSTVPPAPLPFVDSFAADELFVVSLSGGTPPRQVTHNAVIEGVVEWARTGGGWIAGGIGDPGADRSRWTQGRLFAIDAAAGRLQRLAADFSGSFGDWFELTDGSLVTAAVVGAGSGVFHLDRSSGRLRTLATFDGLVSHLAASGDGRRIALVRSGPEGFEELYLAEGIAGIPTARRVTAVNAALSAGRPPGVEVVRWDNGEGDTVEGVLFRPPGAERSPPLPLVVALHGGPWAAASATLASEQAASFYPALLASRGYLVLAPNYRGSVGRGDAFAAAIEGFSCSRPVTDVLTGIDYLVARGWADRERLAAVGHSYGATVVNCLVTRSDRLRAACSAAGMWNDLSYFGTSDNFVQTDVRYLGKAPWEAPEAYWRESAISGSGRLHTPTLFSVGELDRRAPAAQSLEGYRAFVRQGVPAELLLFAGEGHFLATPANQRAKVEAELAWLARYLGPPASPGPP